MTILNHHLKQWEKKLERKFTQLHKSLFALLIVHYVKLEKKVNDMVIIFFSYASVEILPVKLIRPHSSHGIDVEKFKSIQNKDWHLIF